MAKKCECKLFKRNIPIFDNMTMMVDLHNSSDGTLPGYQGDFWEYCPWCGKELNGKHLDNEEEL